MRQSRTLSCAAESRARLLYEPVQHSGLETWQVQQKKQQLAQQTQVLEAACQRSQHMASAPSREGPG